MDSDEKKELTILHKEREKHMEKLQQIDKAIADKLGLNKKQKTKKIMSGEEFRTLCL